MHEFKDKVELLEFLKAIVTAIGGEQDMLMLEELADLAIEIEQCLRKQDAIPAEKFKRWNEIIEKLYPDKE